MAIYKCIILLVMVIHSITDIKYKKVIMELTLAGIGVGVICLLFDVVRETFEYEQLLALLPGIVCLIMGRITKEAIGYGDGMIFLMLGFFYEWECLCMIGMRACILAAIAALICLIILHKNRKYELPFVPFLTFAVWVEEFCV